MTVSTVLISVICCIILSNSAPGFPVYGNIYSVLLSSLVALPIGEGQGSIAPTFDVYEGQTHFTVRVFDQNAEEMMCINFNYDYTYYQAARVQKKKKVSLPEAKKQRQQRQKHTNSITRPSVKLGPLFPIRFSSCIATSSLLSVTSLEASPNESGTGQNELTLYMSVLSQETITSGSYNATQTVNGLTETYTGQLNSVAYLPIGSGASGQLIPTFPVLMVRIPSNLLRLIRINKKLYASLLIGVKDQQTRNFKNQENIRGS